MSSISGINSSGYASSNSWYGKIASGNKLPSAASGAAELSISEKEEAQIRGYDTGTNNMQDGQNMLNISDAALSGVTDYLQRIRELSLQASNTATYTAEDRQTLQDEISQLKQGIQDIATQTSFNTQNLLDGSRTQGFQITSDASGSSVSVNNNINATLAGLGIENYDVTGNFDIKQIDDAIAKVSSSRSSIGAQTNRLDYSINNNGYSSYNTTAAQSRLKDTDYPQAISELKKQQNLRTYALMMQKKQMENESRRMQNFFTM